MVCGSLTTTTRARGCGLPVKKMGEKVVYFFEPRFRSKKAFWHFVVSLCNCISLDFLLRFDFCRKSPFVHIGSELPKKNRFASYGNETHTFLTL